MNYSNVRVGGGCRPTGLNRSTRPSIPLSELVKQQLAKMKKEREELEAWLKTPEGILATALAEELRLAELERQKVADLERAQEDARADAWYAAYQRLRNNPPAAGEVIKAEHTYAVTLLDDEKRQRVSAYALLQIIGRNPNDPSASIPYRQLGISGRWGLKIFLNKASTTWLCTERNVDIQNLPCVELIKRDIRIIGAAASGNALHGAFVE